MIYIDRWGIPRKRLTEDQLRSRLPEFQYEVDLGVQEAGTSKKGAWAQWILTKDELTELLDNWNPRWEARTPLAHRNNQGFHPTAIRRTSVPAPIREYLAMLPPRQGLKILYHGVGQDRPGTEALSQGGNEVRIYDPWHPEEDVTVLPEGPFDEIHSHYTLNVVNQEEGREVVEEIRDRLAPGGRAVITVRRDLEPTESVVRSGLLGERLVAVEVPWMRSKGDQVQDVYLNPVAADLTRAFGHHGQTRAFLNGEDLIVWPIASMIHADVAKGMGLPEDAISLYLYGGGAKVDEVVVSDWVERGPWNHNPKLREHILNHKRLMHYASHGLEVDYYDWAVVGPWENLPEVE